MTLAMTPVTVMLFFVTVAVQCMSATAIARSRGAAGFPWAPLAHKQSTSRLSQARRNLGAVSVDDHAYFAGGCLTTGSGSTQFICDEASSAVDVLDATGTLIKTLQLSEARGWVATCTNGPRVIMVGGGKSGILPHSRVADVVS